MYYMSVSKHTVPNTKDHILERKGILGKEKGALENSTLFNTQTLRGTIL